MKKIFNQIYDFIFNDYRYFIVVKIKNKNDNLLDKGIISFVKNYFFWKFSKIEYYEYITFDNIDGYLVFGNCENNGSSINKLVYIFLVELVNELKNGVDYKVSNDFPCFIKKKSNYIFKIYKVKKCR